MDTVFRVRGVSPAGHQHSNRPDGSEAPAVDADDMIVKGHRPILALVIEIDEVFHHCSKAFLRSQLWRHETWTDPVPPRPTNPPTCQNPVGLWPNWVLTSWR